MNLIILLRFNIIYLVFVKSIVATWGGGKGPPSFEKTLPPRNFYKKIYILTFT